MLDKATQFWGNRFNFLRRIYKLAVILNKITNIMILKSERPYNIEEIELLKKRKNSIWQHFENFAKKWLIVILILILPLLGFDKFIAKVSSETQLIILIPVLIISILVSFFLMKRNGETNWNKKIENEIENGKAQILRIKTSKVIKRQETYDFGSGFYLKISENETIYLQGQIYDELHYVKKFPNTDFEISKTLLTQDDFLNINFFGEYLKPEKKLNAFLKEDYENEKVHYNGDILKVSIDEIK